MQRLVMVLMLVVATSQVAFASKGDREARLAQTLRTDVGLDETTAQKVETLVKQQRDQARATRARVKAAKANLEVLVTSGSKDDGAYRKAIQDLRTARQDRHRLKEGQVDELQKVLTPQQQARLVLVRHHAGKRGSGDRGR